MKKEKFTIIIDSREQKPYRFKRAIVKNLKAGDYSVAGLEDKITIERKTKSDAYGTIGKGRKRFKKELENLINYDYKAIVVECSLADFLKSPVFSKLSPRSAINSLISWNIKYKVNIFFASNRKLARALVYRLLQKYRKEFLANE